MCTFNGQKYLKEQLDSIEAQTFQNWRLIVSDDGSTDFTLQILSTYQERWGESRMEIRQGPKLGFCKNFLSLIGDASIRVTILLYVIKMMCGYL